MSYVLNLDEVGKENRNVGQKAASLGEMIKAGLPVPSGFVLTTETYELFLRFNKIDEKIPPILKDLDVENTAELKQKSKEIEDLFIKSEFPDAVKRSLKDYYENMGLVREAKNFSGPALDIIKAGRDKTFVAVRSSIIVDDPLKTSFAGQLRSYINISGTDQLLEAIKRCWASLFSAKSIYYRKKHISQSSELMGVVIQKMIDADKSGIVYTNGFSGATQNSAIIEASWGLGPSVTSNLLSPDVYIVDKSRNQTIDKKISKKPTLFRRDQIGKTVRESVSPDRSGAQVLSEFDISRIVDIGKKAENLLGGGQDIEWCIERGRAFIVQSRPIVSVEKISLPIDHIESEPVVSGFAASRGFSTGKSRVLNNMEEAESIQRGEISISKFATTDITPYIHKMSAIITDDGGITNNFASVCREFGLPFVSGTGKASQVIPNGQELMVDAESGKVFLHQPKEVHIEPPNQTEPIDTGLTATEIKVNIISSSESFKGADGGLIKSENLLLEIGTNPLLIKTNQPEVIEKVSASLAKIASSLNPSQVWYRSLDVRTDEYQNIDNIEDNISEANPLLGWHGIRRSLDQAETIKLELEMLKKLFCDGIRNMTFVLPFVTNVEEVRATKKLIDFPIKIGVVVETPASAIDIERICKEGIDAVLIDLNDLTQLVLGVDRLNPSTSKLYSELHPSVLFLVKNTISTCKKHGIKTCIFGEAVNSSPELVEKLVEFGIDSISVDSDSIQSARNTVIRTEKKLLLDRVRE